MSEMNKFAPSPQHGAALRYMLSRFNIASITSKDDLDALAAIVGSVKAFAATQNPEVQRAYQWACDLMMHDAAARWDVISHSMRVMQAYADLPKPPQ